MALLDTCGEEGGLYGQGGLWTSSTAIGDGRILSWFAIVATPGGQYRLCWCGQKCQDAQATDFRVDTGNLVLIGPCNQQLWTCVSGQTCPVIGLEGEKLSAFDRYAVLETCGQAATSRLDPWTIGISVAASKLRVDGGSKRSVAAGGRYRLCWCSEDLSC